MICDAYAKANRFSVRISTYEIFQIRDAYPKMIVARTKHPKYSYEGIEIYDIADWLLQE